MLLRWFKAYNRGKAYREQAKPFNFMLAFQAANPQLASIAHSDDGIDNSDGVSTARCREKCSETADRPRAIAPYDQDPDQAAQRCFDRETGKPILREQLKTYREVLAQYHLHPEAKFSHADYTDSGLTDHRHIKVTAVEDISKEANRWEEQFYLGEDPEAQTAYGTAAEDLDRPRDFILEVAQQFGQRKRAQAAGVSLREVFALVRG